MIKKTIYAVLLAVLTSTSAISEPTRQSSYQEIDTTRRSPIPETRVSFAELPGADQVRECFVYRHKKKLLAGAAAVLVSGVTWIVRPDYALYCFLGAVAGPVASCCSAAVQDANLEEVTLQIPAVIPR